MSAEIVVDDQTFAAQNLEAIPQELVPQAGPITLPAAVPTPPAFPSIVEGSVQCLGTEQQMIADAYTDLNKVISSDLFKTQTLAAAFTENNGLTNQQIYDLMVTKSPVPVDFTMYTGGVKANYVYHTMGYEDPNNPTVCFANRHFIQDKDTCASLILHESMHILGFHHYAVKATSVPYTMNAIYTKVSTALGV